MFTFFHGNSKRVKYVNDEFYQSAVCKVLTDWRRFEEHVNLLFAFVFLHYGSGELVLFFSSHFSVFRF